MIEARFCVLRGRGERGLPQIPPVHLDPYRGAHPTAQWKNAGHERNLSDGDAVDEVFASAIDSISDAEHVLTVFGYFIGKRGVRIETVIVVERHHFAVRVAERQHGLEPAGYGVGDVGDQLPRGRGDNQMPALPRLEAIPVDFSRCDLSVHGARWGDADLLLVQRSLAEGEILLTEHLKAAGLHGLAGDFGNLSDEERHCVRHASVRHQPDLPPTGLRVGRDSHLDKGQAGQRIAGRSSYVAVNSPLYPGRDLPGQLVLLRRLAFQFSQLVPQDFHLLGGQFHVILD